MSVRTATSSVWYLLKTTFEQWAEDNAIHHSAALTFYTVFSLAPLLVIGVAIAGIFVAEQAIQDQIVGWVRQYIRSPEVAELVRDILQNVSAPQSSIFATVISLIGLFFGATAIFSELRNTLNLIWDVPLRTEWSIRDLIVDRLLALGMVIVSGFILLSSMIVSFVLSIATNLVELLPFGGNLFGQIISFLFFFTLTTFVFALIYKFVPDRSIAWGDVWIGALATALLFSTGRYLITLYMGYSTVASAYGAAGSLAILLVWIYYSSQVFFLGAEFTQVYTRTYGTRWVEHELLEETPDENKTYRGEIEEPPAVQAAKSRPNRAVKSVADLAVAVTVIGVVSLVSLVREPFRK